VRTIIAGSREITDPELLLKALEKHPHPVTEVVCGTAPGVDTLGEDWAKVNNIPVKYFKPDWDTHGKAAGPIRNRQMAEYGEALIAIWNGDSPGTKNMIEEAQKRKLHVTLFHISVS
jgi:hypothetical protein